MADKNLKTKVILNDLCEQIVDAEHKTAPTQTFGIPYVRTPDVKNTQLILDEVQRVSENTYKDWTKRAEPKPYDIILCREAPVGDSGMILPNQKVCLGQRTVLIRPNNEKIYPKYLLFLLNSPKTQHELLSNSGGTHVAHLNMKDIRNLSVEIIHSSDEQEFIGDLLFNLNSLIDALKNQNKILEIIVQTIFKSWFVDFDGVTEFEDSGLDKIPKGWKIETLDNVCKKITDGSHFSPKEDLNGTKRMASVKHMKKYDFESCKKISEKDFKKLTKNGCKIEKNDVLLSKDGTMGLSILYQSSNDLVALSSIAILKSKEDFSSYFLKCYLHQKDNISILIGGHSSGSALPRIVLKDLKTFKILVPNNIMLKKFDNFAKPIFSEMFSNFNKIRSLSKTRDALLPKLILGEIRV